MIIIFMNRTVPIAIGTAIQILLRRTLLRSVNLFSIASTIITGCKQFLLP